MATQQQMSQLREQLGFTTVSEFQEQWQRLSSEARGELLAALVPAKPARRPRAVKAKVPVFPVTVKVAGEVL